MAGTIAEPVTPCNRMTREFAVEMPSSSGDRVDDCRAVGAGIQHQPKRPLAVEHDRRPHPADAVATRRCDVAWLRCFDEYLLDGRRIDLDRWQPWS